jgi:hypothetical protein
MRKFPYFVCAFVTNFSIEAPRRLSGAGSIKYARGVCQSMFKPSQFDVICVQNARIFANFSECHS